MKTKFQFAMKKYQGEPSLRSWNLLLLSVFCAVAAGGCLSRQVAKDGIGIRQAMMDLYTDQAMDNLIRAHDHRLFVQLKYSNLSVNDKCTLNASATGETGTFTTALAATTRALTSAFAFPVSGSASSDRNLSFQADPVVDQNYIYQEYLSFAQNPCLFVVDCNAPQCPCQIVRKCGNTWYYVPAAAGSAFLQLVIDTSVGLETKAAGVWTATVKSATPIYDVNGDPLTTRDPDGKPYPQRYQLTLDTPVPNDAGRMLLALAAADKRSVVLEVFPVDQGPYLAKDPKNPQQQAKVGPPLGALTTIIYASAMSIQAPAPDQLTNATVVYYADNYPNTKPAANTDAQKIIDALDTIRIETIRNTNRGN